MLHTHDIAITPVDFLIKDASYRDNLYICEPASNSELVLFQFAPGKPADLPTCQYELVSTRRAQIGAQQFDARLGTIFSLYTDNPQGRLWSFRQHAGYAFIGFLYNSFPFEWIEAYPDINTVWSAFESTLISASGIISYAPVFVDYFYQALQSFYDDNVQYVEIRTTIPEVSHLMFRSSLL